MGFWGKIFPWKRKDDLALNENFGLGLGGMEQQQFQPLQQPFGGMQMPMQVPQPQQPQIDAFQGNQAYERSYGASKDLEIVSAKLDAIKAALETLNQRLAALERYMQTEQDFKKRGGW